MTDDPEELLTGRLSLRRPVPGDIDAILAINSDPLATQHNPGDRLADRSEAEDLYRRWDDQWERHGFGYWVVRPRDGGATVGFCGVKVMRLRGEQVLNLFYRLTPSAWGTGIATEAACAVTAWVAEHGPSMRVIARVRPANIASQRVAQRAGLHRAPHLDEPGEDGLDWIFTNGR